MRRVKARCVELDLDLDLILTFLGSSHSFASFGERRVCFAFNCDLREFFVRGIKATFAPEVSVL